jgi:uncharacterized RDD family membrane protein YckC
VVLIGSSRFVADLQQETVPDAFRGPSVDLCDVVATAAGTPTSICFRIGDTLYSSTSPNAPVKILAPAVLVMFLNSVVWATRRDASLGMSVFGLRVVRRDTGALAGGDRLLVRWVSWLADGFAFFLVGIGATLGTAGQRRLGDLVAGTVVVTEGSVGTPPTLAPAVIRLRPAATADSPQWDAAPQFDDVGPPPRPLT